MGRLGVSLTQFFVGLILALVVGLSSQQPWLIAATPNAINQSALENTHTTLPNTEARTLSFLLEPIPAIAPDISLQQGRAFYQAGQFTQAIAAWQQSVAAFQAQKDIPNQALALSYLSLAQQQIGNWREAEQAIATSLELLQTHSTSTKNHALIRAQVLNAQGTWQLAQGQSEQALETWQRVTAIYQKIGDQQRQIGSLINQAQAEQSLGLFLRSRQTLGQATQLLQQQPSSELKVMGLRSLGNVLLLTGNVKEARQSLQESLAIAEQLSLSESASMTLLSLGNAARAQNAPQEALSFYQQAAIATVPIVQVQARLNQLSLLLDREQWTEAESLVAALSPQLEQLPPSRATIYAQINFAQNLMRWNQEKRRASDRSSFSRQAATILAQALQQAKNIGDHRAEAYVLGYLGGVYEQNQQWTEAQALTEQALLIAQSMNAPEIAYQWQWQLGRVLKAQGQAGAATQAYQAAFQTLQSIRGDLVATSPDLQFSFREQVEPVYRELVDLLLQRSPQTSSDPADLKQAREVIEALQVAELDNFFRAACLEGQRVAIDAIDQTEAAVIYPIILRDRLEVILSLPGQPLQHYATQVAQSEVEATLEQLRQNFEKPLTTPEGKRLSQQLYDWLIRPIETKLTVQRLQTLVFVLDGSLRNVPMAALYDGKQYLVERYSVALAPGLQLLDPKPLRQYNLQALAAGITEERSGFSALLNVGSEIAGIQAEITSRVLLNQAFTSTALAQQVAETPFPVVHLATHGQFSSNSDETFILAWDKPIKVNELSALLRDRDDLQTNAIELLVLSACQTASGDKRAALGLAGVAIQSGARSTLASLWSLDDESGAKFVNQFYQTLVNEKVSKAEALRQAQLQLLRDPDYRHPRYWAPYVLVGNWL